MGVEDIGIPHIGGLDETRPSSDAPAANFGAARGLPFPCRNITSRVAVAAASLSVARKRTRTGRRETSSWFRENKASLEAADTAADRRNEGQAAANLPHDAINNGEPETAAGTDR